MYSYLIRFIYSLTYFSLLPILLEIINVAANWDNLTISWNANVVNTIGDIVSIHYPIIVFLLLLFLANLLIKHAGKVLSQTTIFVKKSNSIGISSCLFISQLIPLLTFAGKIIGEISPSLVLFISLASILLLAILLLAMGGTYNVALLLLGYKQYRVATEHVDYWLISKRKINNFSQGFNVVEISDKVLLRL